jgi:subtilase family protein
MEKNTPQILDQIKEPNNPDQREACGHKTRVVVKFHDFVKLPYEDGVEIHFDKCGIGPWERLTKEFSGITVKRLFTALSQERIRELVDRATAADRRYQPPNMLTYFAIEYPPGVDPEALVASFLKWQNVQTAYVEGRPGPPPAINPNNDPRSSRQGYLNPAPDGIDARFVWANLDPGGGGEGIQFVDLEQGWTLNHEDLPAARIPLISGFNQDFFSHGTSVLGGVVAVDNLLGNVGIAPKASARVISEWRTPTTYNTADAVMEAVAELDFGDVLLLETQYWPLSGGQALPVEVQDAVFDSIRLGAARGIVIVEAAGNGAHDLDTYTDAGGRRTLNRSSADFKDSGAIMVGAASSATPHTRKILSNFGSRIDCYAWGENVDTLATNWSGTATNQYTASFDGTSSASSIIAGAALIVQSAAQQTLNRRYSPSQIRDLLSDPATGTKSNNPAVDRIGVMPNLKNIVQNSLNIIPDIYIRDFVGDIGDPHMSAISASPDVILKTAKASDPQIEFGEGSGTENSNTLSDTAEAGRDNYVYVRVRNRGGADADDVTATVYWSPVATLITPDLWTFIGSVTIPKVPSGDQLTVSKAITWDKLAIPDPGHYCFVCLVGNAKDPAPGRVEFLNWDNYRLFIRNNNNVAWRNFNVVLSSACDHGALTCPIAMPFLAPGAPDQARRMRLEVVGGLPEGSRLCLEAPLRLIEAMQEHTRYVEVDCEKKTGLLPLNPYGRQALGEILFPAKSRTQLRLLAQIPGGCQVNEYEVSVSQLYENEEVGRVTWRLAPRDRRDQRTKARGK